MRAARTLAGAAFFAAALLISGCSSSANTSDISLSSSFAVSRDGVLRYRLPSGWFDASADSQAVGPVVWLLKNDYSATITVEEVHADERARKELEKGGLLQLAQMTMALTSGNSSVSLTEPPQVFTMGGRQFCSYQLAGSASNDLFRVILFNTGTRFYSVTALVSGKPAGEIDGEVFAAQQSLLRSLRW